MKHNKLPINCEISIDDIPKNVKFDNDKQQFYAEFETHSKTFRFTSDFVDYYYWYNPNPSIKEKLGHIKRQLSKFYNRYPKFITYENIIDERQSDPNKLRIEYNEILKKSGYEIDERNYVCVK